MHAFELLDGFDFHDDAVFHQEVDPVPAVDELEYKARFIRGLEHPWTEFLMNADRR